MYRQVDVARTYVHAVAAARRGGRGGHRRRSRSPRTPSVACAEHVADQAVQLHGGAGYMHGVEVERHYRDVRVLGIGGGATGVMTDYVARRLGW